MVFQIIAIVILCAFYGCYFIKMFSQKKKGIQTNQIGKGKSGLVKYIELTMKVVTIIVPILEVISICANTTRFPSAVRIVGVVLGCFGVLIFISAVVTMRDSWRAGVAKTDKTELVQRGIYQISRNPAFLGFELVYIGILYMFFNWGLFAISLYGIIIFHLQIVNVEEEFLAEQFGDSYLEYKSKVNRYLGRKLGR